MTSLELALISKVSAIVVPEIFLFKFIEILHHCFGYLRNDLVIVFTTRTFRAYSEYHALLIDNARRTAVRKVRT